MLAGLGCRSLDRSTNDWAAVDLTEPGWQIQQGQAVWRPSTDATEWVGDLLLAGHEDGRFWVVFSKNPIVLVTARRDGPHWRVEWPVRRRIESGEGASPPDQLWLYWAEQMTEQMAERNGWPITRDTEERVVSERPSDVWEWAQPQPGHWVLLHRVRGERLEGYLE
jgi:hypothetical protein